MYIYNTKRTFARISLIFIVFLFIAVVSYVYRYSFGWFDQIEYYLSLFVIFGLAILAVTYNVFIVPLYRITRQVASVIAGEKYTKISVVSKNEFGLLAYFFNELTRNVENISHFLKEGSRMANELAVARDIQKSVLPNSIPVIPFLDTVAKTRPAEEVGGDSFDIEQKDSQYFIYIGDVTGHGAPAGLIMMMVNTLFDIFMPISTNTYDLAVKINKILKPRVNNSMFMTAAFLRWDTQSKKMFYTGAGHEHIIIYRSKEGVTEVIPTGGIALAMAEDISQIVEEKEINLSDQDILVMYSDGITEAVNQNGELFGLERLKFVVNESGYLGSSLQIFESISVKVQNFVEDTVQKDDMTLLVMRFCDKGYEPDRPNNLVSTKWHDNE